MAHGFSKKGFPVENGSSSQVWLGDDPETDTFGGPQ